MGLLWSYLNRAQEQHYFKAEEFVIIPSAEDWLLKFDPDKSYAMCVGFNANILSIHSKILEDTATKSAKILKEAISGNIVNCDRVDLYTSEDMCTKQALSVLTKNNAKKVQQTGIFIFQYSGQVAYDNDELALVPVDFTVGDIKSGITADDLLKWIFDGSCKACHVLIILDCCCAGKIGEKIASLATLKAGKMKQDIHVLCSCTATEDLPPIKILGTSLFSYFLSYSMTHEPAIRGLLAIKNSMDETASLTHSFSSLVLSYTEKDGLTLANAKPEMHSTIDNKVYDETDASVRFLIDMYDCKSDIPPLHQEAIWWLNTYSVQEGLRVLLQRTSLPAPLLDGILCALLYSLSCIHLKYDRTHLGERNLFVTAIINVVSTITYAYPNISITRDQIKLALSHANHYGVWELNETCIYMNWWKCSNLECNSHPQS
ncbi:uncharacterized protein [Dysidea avara]|uniref:uncharacterized protein n=1 Tax=Dysidea avara TaxID=196820 RepID=UPI00332D0D99